MVGADVWFIFCLQNSQLCLGNKLQVKIQKMKLAVFLLQENVALVSTRLCGFKNISLAQPAAILSHHASHIVCCEASPMLFLYKTHRGQMARSPSLQLSACVEIALPGEGKYDERNQHVSSSQDKSAAQQRFAPE